MTMFIIAAADEASHPEALIHSINRLRMDPPIRSRFREASWDDALNWPARSPISAMRAAAAPSPLRLCEGSNGRVPLPEARAHGLGSNNVDYAPALSRVHVASLLRASARRRLQPVLDGMKAEVVLLIGANPSSIIGGSDLDQDASMRGTKLILAEPRRSGSRGTRTHFLQLKPAPTRALTR